MRLNKLVGIIALLAAFAVAAIAQNSKPRMPFVDKGACPFECCTYRDWSVDKPTVVRSAMRDSAPIAFRLRKGQRVRGLTGTVITSQPGEVEALKRQKVGDFTVEKGDRLYLLTYIGEGFFNVWYKDKITEGETHDQTLFRQIREPKSVWWVKVRNSKGKIGWSREPENFGNQDQCG